MGRPAIYHLISRTVAGEKLLERKDQEVLRSQMRQMAAFCGIEILTYCILSNHFHLLAKVPAKREHSDEELVRRYAILYGEGRARTLEENLRSSPRRARIREGLLRRMEDVSFFMKELKMRFTIYFNKTHSRFGTLWAERFKSLLVESRGNRNAVLAVAAYIDLNPLRAGLAGDPKDYRFSGYAEAVAGGREARNGLTWIVGRTTWREALREYRVILFSAGMVADRSKEGGFSVEECQEVLENGGKIPFRELLRCRVRYFADGIALGSARFAARVRREAIGSSEHRSGIPKMPAAEETELFFARRQKRSSNLSS